MSGCRRHPRNVLIRQVESGLTVALSSPDRRGSDDGNVVVESEELEIDLEE